MRNLREAWGSMVNDFYTVFTQNKSVEALEKSASSQERAAVAQEKIAEKSTTTTAPTQISNTYNT